MVKVLDYTSKTGKVIPISNDLLNLGETTDVTYNLSGEGYYPKEVIEIRIFDTELHLVYMQYPMTTPLSLQAAVVGDFKPTIPRVFKEVYEMRDGRLKFTQTVEGTYIPPQPEKIQF